MRGHRLCRCLHGADFIAGEDHPILAHTRLFQNGRATIFTIDQPQQHDPHRDQHDQSDHAQQDEATVLSITDQGAFGAMGIMLGVGKCVKSPNF